MRYGWVVAVGLALTGCASSYAMPSDYTLVVFWNRKAEPCQTLWSIAQYPNSLLCLSEWKPGTLYAPLSGPFINRRQVQRLMAMRENGTMANYEPRILPLPPEDQHRFDEALKHCRTHPAVDLIFEPPAPLQDLGGPALGAFSYIKDAFFKCAEPFLGSSGLNFRVEPLPRP